ncbi:hypothetical protein COY16_02320 [Candidatus Roizmanbacteria bacterium CG_4_10_14_0_2_um_filter_39_13]|uniref:Type II secretion system protein GspG C-terminal domain-containing protein n=1 Tax=Candidatus Roizmanbacteria bacterium CG_4_10_14_0_2_um_filter_39_13 TaxID=1974825 RepID=A0A2M7TZT7_9BACT|nr:MAG: hypothetical protein COY16_02320 [Candidatus Roizmanbacteria bacterium CG_4_10_14_0_2_um_filter_39_13]
MSNVRNRSGFSLIEIIVVVVIISILVAIGSTSYTTYVEKGRDDRRILDVEMLREVLEKYYSNQAGGFYPLDTSDLIVGGYMQRRPADPVTNQQGAYRYTPLPTGCDNATIYCSDYTLEVDLERKGSQYAVSSNEINGTIVP